MEKLEKLLKEYAPNYCNDLPNGIIMDELVISKKFGFIKWLVENDKIDLYKLPIRLEEYYQSTEAVGYITDDETILLMQLAIQDEPIEFLVSILK